MNALFNDSIFSDSETILLKEIFISHSKNVVTQRKEKADKSALIRTAQFVVWMSLLNYLAKLLQKSEMRKDIVIELSYKGFG